MEKLNLDELLAKNPEIDRADIQLFLEEKKDNGPIMHREHNSGSPYSGKKLVPIGQDTWTNAKRAIKSRCCYGSI